MMRRFLLALRRLAFISFGVSLPLSVSPRVDTGMPVRVDTSLLWFLPVAVGYLNDHGRNFNCVLSECQK